jgi:hypothetical protein
MFDQCIEFMENILIGYSPCVIWGRLLLFKNIEARKLDNEGKIVMFLGYPDSHPTKTYRLGH